MEFINGQIIIKIIISGSVLRKRERRTKGLEEEEVGGEESDGTPKPSSGSRITGAHHRSKKMEKRVFLGRKWGLN